MLLETPSLAACTVAVVVAEKALRKANKAELEVEKLTKALKQSESLAILTTTPRTFTLALHTRCSSAAGQP